METTTNLKRRRDSGEGASKNMCSGPSYHKVGPSDTFPQTQPPPQPATLQPLPPPPPPPQYCYPQHAPPVNPYNKFYNLNNLHNKRSHSSQQKPDPLQQTFLPELFP